jgi:ABC-type multidrug transport system ATPase subunit
MPIVEMEMGLALANRAVPAEEIGRRVEWALEVVDLAGYRRRPTKALSGGQKQRLVLGAALTSLPPLLVLDEPTAQLDPLGSRELLRAISKLRQERRVTIVMTTHKTEEVLDLATHALVLEEGRAVAYGPYGEVMRQVDLLEAAGVQAPPAEHVAWRVRRRGVALPPGAAEEAVVEALRSRAWSWSTSPSATPARSAPPSRTSRCAWGRASSSASSARTAPARARSSSSWPA